MRPVFGFYFLLGALFSCTPGNLKHQRFIVNNTSEDTLVVRNGDIMNAIDTIFPAASRLIYEYEVLDTKQEYESCKWQGEMLSIETKSGELINRSVIIESNWTYTMSGDKERTQKCSFVVTDDDF